jgi:hypothetical protein
MQLMMITWDLGSNDEEVLVKMVMVMVMKIVKRVEKMRMMEGKKK